MNLIPFISCHTLECPAGVWGKGCLEVCLCENDAECDYISGECSCTLGWMGTYCNMCKFKNSDTEVP